MPWKLRLSTQYSTNDSASYGGASWRLLFLTVRLRRGHVFFFLLACVSYWTVKVKCLSLLQLSPSCGARTDLFILRSYDGTTILERERHEGGARRKRRRNPFNQPPKGDLSRVAVPRGDIKVQYMICSHIKFNPLQYHLSHV